MCDQSDSLYIDIGNTRIHWRHEGKEEALPIGHAQQIVQYLTEHPEIQQVAAVSVAHPELLGRIRGSARAVSWYVVDECRESLMPTDYHRTQLGLDRWLACLAVAALEPAGRHVVVDAGTAVTIDVVDRGRHRGGWILPGYGRWHDALLKGTHIPVRTPADAHARLGRSTPEAIANGWLNAVLGAVESATGRDGEPPRIWLTGGDRDRLSQHARDASVRSNLVIDGLCHWLADITCKAKA